MTPLLRILLSLLVGLALAFVFTIPVMDLFAHPFIEQALLIFFAAASFGYFTFEWFGARTEIAGWWMNLRRKLFRFSSTAFISFLRENAAGLALAVAFFAIYTYLGLQLNSPTNDTVDNYLDADNFSWMQRISFPDGHEFEMRGPHPFAYLVFRPLGWAFNLFTRNPYLTSLLINTLTGALCVFLMWFFINHKFQNRTYATLIAALLGLSTSHLFFGSVIESYIFSAAALIGFFLLLEMHKESTGSLVGMALLTFGITLTNFVQNLIGFFFVRQRLKELIRFAGLTISFGILLSMIHAAMYPSAKLFFLPSGAQAEEEFATSLLQEPSWKIIGRVMLVIRTILLYTVIAPRPYFFVQEVGGDFPRFNFFKVSPGDFLLSAYNGLGNILVLVWAALLLVAGMFFLRNLIRTRKADLSLAFVLCLGFNFILHLNYGYEPFLYSPDWAYALIFFVAFGLSPFAGKRWLQVGMLTFLVLLAYNQWQFFDFIFDTIAPYIDQGCGLCGF